MCSKEELQMKNAESKGLWVFVEYDKGIISPTPLELIAKAHDLKEKLGGRDTVTAVLLCSDAANISRTLFSYGAERIIAVEDKALSEYKPRVYARVLSTLVEKYNPSIFLFAATPIGRELAPCLMCRLQTGLTADAIDLDIDEDGVFVQTTPNFGGSVLSHIAIPERRPQMCTVHPKVFTALSPNENAVGELIKVQVEVIPDDDYIILGSEEKPLKGVSIDKANVVVSGGYGIKDQKDLDMLDELSKLIGGQLGCSRPLYEKGWLGHESQIGQSGATISPKLIINTAISGSVQYMAGMDKSKCIISINQNAHAPIFDLSHYGAVADYRELIPAIKEEIKNRRLD